MGTTTKLLQLSRSSNGQDGGVSFFLPPYCKIVELIWSSGVKKEKTNGKGRKMTVFDSRPWYMNYEFVVRTHDNIELLLSISFFWSLENIAFMIRNTDDAPGDMSPCKERNYPSSLKSNIETIYGEFQLYCAR